MGEARLEDAGDRMAMKGESLSRSVVHLRPKEEELLSRVCSEGKIRD